MFGSGIYFAESAEIAYAKAWHKEIGCIIEAEVALGRCYEPQQAEDFTYRRLKRMGYDSVWARPAPHGPMGTSQEWIVYSKYQVRLLSVKADGKELLYKRAKAGGLLSASERGRPSRYFSSRFGILFGQTCSSI